MSTAHLILAGALFCMSGVGFAQSPPATGGRIFRDPPAVTAGPGDGKAVAPAANATAKKTFNESRSNALRTPGDSKANTTGVNPSGTKGYFEPRSNSAKRTTGDPKATVPETSALTTALPAQPALK